MPFISSVGPLASSLLRVGWRVFSHEAILKHLANTACSFIIQNVETRSTEVRVERIQLLLFVAALLLIATVVTVAFRALPPYARTLPAYALMSVGRIFAAYILSLVFALSMGFAAATNRRARAILLPAIDILQSVPVVGFFPVAISVFIALFHGERLGIELASIFLIFTSQAWNMAFGVYESIITIPKDIIRLAQAYGVSGSLAALRIYLPATIPNLVYNSMVSWANSWFFLMSSEVFAIGVARYELPGLGYYLFQASQKGNVFATVLGLVVLFFVVLFMEVFIWRPLTQWSRRYTYQMIPFEEEERSTPVLSFLIDVTQTLRLDRVAAPLRAYAASLVTLGYHVTRALHEKLSLLRVLLKTAVRIALFALLVYLGALLARFAIWLFSQPWPVEAHTIPTSLALSIVRLFGVYCLAAATTVVLAYLIYFHPRFGEFVLAVSKVMASIPGTATIPLFLVILFRFETPYRLEIASAFVLFSTMIWYILFPVAGQVTNIPRELRESVESLVSSRSMILRRLVLPAAFPGFVTGSLAAWGAGWNALVVSEYIFFRGKVLSVRGIGALIDRAAYEKGDTVLLSLCLLAMIVTIILSNRLVWQPLYELASRKYSLEVD
jgi:NitT/TauT family transport system permease protein